MSGHTAATQYKMHNDSKKGKENGSDAFGSGLSYCNDSDSDNEHVSFKNKTTSSTV